MTETKIKIITENRKARHDYNIVEAMEAGMELVGTEVKSLRAGKVNLKDSFVRITKKGTGCDEHAHQSLRFWQLQ